jgi:23S rRNA (guanine745-N1)-methyltransferase
VSSLACPIDLSSLDKGDGAWRCPDGHAYDIAREGYVNLLPPGRPARQKAGDDLESIHARRRFLDAGHYAALAEHVAEVSAELSTGEGDTVDVGCGEGYYTARLAGAVVGLDMSRAGIRLAARRHTSVTFAVANATAMPIVPAAVDVAVSIFAPVVPDEFARIVRPGGHAVIAVPGAQHLAALRSLLYETWQPHDEVVPLHDDTRFTTVDTARLRGEATLATPTELADLISMTPYRYAVPPEAIARALAAPTPFTTPIEFVVATIRRN